ncbi:MAG: hypothetical protein JSV20_10455 [Candidatus Bathyarchaeota archaeon]|nr:MAG: hypothetical protein JSV20_10455 [Candidatus Bathyarchaeota archaeon]
MFHKIDDEIRVLLYKIELLSTLVNGMLSIQTVLLLFKLLSDVHVLAAVVMAIISFIITYIATPFLIQFFIQRGITGIDVHKIERPVRAEMCG